MDNLEKPNLLYGQIAGVIKEAKLQVYKGSNAILLKMYWEVGKLILEDEQHGAERAVYGKATIKNLAKKLTVEFGKRL